MSRETPLDLACVSLLKAFPLLWLILQPAYAAQPPRSIPFEQSAAAAKLAPVEVASRVAAPLFKKDKFPAGYGTDIQLEALMVLDDARGRWDSLEFVRKVAAGMPPEYSFNDYAPQLYSNIWFELFKRNRDPGFIEPFLTQTRKMRAEILRASDGAISVYRDERAVSEMPNGTLRIYRHMAPIFVDQLQEYVSRMAKAGWLSGDPAFDTEAVQQIQVFREALRDPKTGLWAHGRGWSGSERTLVATKWGRGHAWLLRGLIETLTFLPAGSPEAQQVAAVLNEIAPVLLKYQDPEGFWHTVVDRPDSYQETSVTGFISYYFARAVHQGLLPADPYRHASIKAYNALIRGKVAVDGTVYGGSQVTPPLKTTEEYMSWETPVNDHHAVAGVIFSVTGQLLLQRSAPLDVPRHGGG